MRSSFLIRVRKWQFGVMLALCIGGLSLMAYWTFTARNFSGLLKQSRSSVLPPPRMRNDLLLKGTGGWLAIRRFKDWMDSLKNDSAGRFRYDSIVHARPGLMDSVKKALEYYRVN